MSAASSSSSDPCDIGLASYGIDRESFLRAVESLVPEFQPHGEEAARPVTERLRLQPLTGGMSNLLFICERSSGLPHRVVARVLSPSLDAIIDREVELSIFRQLSSSGVSPRLYGIAHLTPSGSKTSPRSLESTEDEDEESKNGGNAAPLCIRVEQHLVGTTLSVKDFRSHSFPVGGLGTEEDQSGSGGDSSVSASDLAERIVQLHAQQPTFPESLSTFAEHLQRYLSMINSLKRVIGVASDDSPSPGLCVCRGYDTDALLDSNSDTTLQQRLCRLLHVVDSWESEASFMLKLFDEENPGSMSGSGKQGGRSSKRAGGGPLVLSHGDLQSGNWILAEQEEEKEAKPSSLASGMKLSSSLPKLSMATTSIRKRDASDAELEAIAASAASEPSSASAAVSPSFQSSPAGDLSRPASRASTASAYEGRVRRADEPGLRTPSRGGGGRASSSRRGSGGSQQLQSSRPSPSPPPPQTLLMMPQTSACPIAGSGPTASSEGAHMISAKGAGESKGKGSGMDFAAVVSPSPPPHSVEGPSSSSSSSSPLPGAAALVTSVTTHYPRDLNPSAFPPPHHHHSLHRRQSSQQGGNLQQRRRRLFIIDFEYAGTNRRGFDLGNLFCEHTFDYSLDHHPGYSFQERFYPSLEWQRQFCLTYARLWKAESGRYHAERVLLMEGNEEGEGLGKERGNAGADGGDELFKRTSASRAAVAEAVGITDGDEEPSIAAFARELVHEARLGIIASHFYWSLWSAVMAAGKAGYGKAMDSARSPTADHDDEAKDKDKGESSAGGGVTSGHSVFDYAHYGLRRALEYLRLKAQLLSEAEGNESA